LRKVAKKTNNDENISSLGEVETNTAVFTYAVVDVADITGNGKVGNHGCRIVHCATDWV